MGKKLSFDYSPGMLAMHQKLLDHALKSASDVFKTASNRVIEKTAEGTGNSNDNKVANRITKVSKNSKQNNSETVTNYNGKEIPKERFISPDEKKEIINNLGTNIIV